MLLIFMYANSHMLCYCTAAINITDQTSNILCNLKINLLLLLLLLLRENKPAAAATTTSNSCHKRARLDTVNLLNKHTQSKAMVNVHGACRD